MNIITRQCFTPDSIRAIRPSKTRLPSSLRPFLDAAVESTMFTIVHLLSIAYQVLNEKVLLVCLAENPTETIRTLGLVLEDHARYYDLKPKDLQLNLAVNLIVRLTRAQDMEPVKQFKYAEDLVRKCEFDSAFKLEIKQSMFDQQALQNRWLYTCYQKAA